LKPFSTRPPHTFIFAFILTFIMTNPQLSATAATDGPSNTLADAAVDIPAVMNDPTVDPRVPNPRGYPPFDLQRVPTYTNRQLRYYQASGALLSIDRAAFKAQLTARKEDMELVNWDGDTRENTPDASVAPSTHASIPASSIVSRTLSYDNDGEPDSDCPDPIPGQKGIKFNASDITKLRWNSDVSEYNSWLSDLKSAFRGDPAKFATGELKVIFASMTIDEKLKITYTTII
jgi:hypothetical protein